jgi:hypothetical protein
MEFAFAKFIIPYLSQIKRFSWFLLSYRNFFVNSFDNIENLYFLIRYSFLLLEKKMSLFTLIHKEFQKETSTNILIKKVYLLCLGKQQFYFCENITLAIVMYKGLLILERFPVLTKTIDQYNFQKTLLLRRFEHNKLKYYPPETSFELLVAGIGNLENNYEKGLTLLKHSWFLDEKVASIFIATTLIEKNTYSKHQVLIDLMLRSSMENKLPFSFFYKAQIVRMYGKKVDEMLEYYKLGVSETGCMYCQLALLHHNVLFKEFRFPGMFAKSQFRSLMRSFIQSQQSRKASFVDVKYSISQIQMIGYICEVDTFTNKDPQRQLASIQQFPIFFTHYFFYKLYKSGDRFVSRNEKEAKKNLLLMLQNFPKVYTHILWQEGISQYHQCHFDFAFYIFRGIEKKSPSDLGKYYMAQSLLKKDIQSRKLTDIAFLLLTNLIEFSNDSVIQKSAKEVISKYSTILPLPRTH